jgi:hypothetical protein
VLSTLSNVTASVPGDLTEEGVVPSGDSAAKQAAAARAVAARYRLKADRATRVADGWDRGARGETALRETTAPLGLDGYYHLDDRRLPESTGNLDLLLVGPAGVFVVDAKSWTGDVCVRDGSLRQNGRSREKHVDAVRRQAIEVASLLDALGSPRPGVRPVICFVGCDGIDHQGSVDRVRLLNSTDLVSYVRGFPMQLDQMTVDAVMRTLLERLPPRTAPLEQLSDAAIVPPEEAVFFIHRWVKHGHRRIYVKADDGSPLGFLNMSTGDVQASDDAWRPVLARLLPVYVAEPEKGEADSELSGEARSALRRFIDAVLGREKRLSTKPILVVSRWRNYGRDRLYVHRIDGPGTRAEIGWVDLAAGTARSTSVRGKEIVDYCAERFRKMQR